MENTICKLHKENAIVEPSFQKLSNVFVLKSNRERDALKNLIMKGLE
jgi:hypothetical protein